MKKKMRRMLYSVCSVVLAATDGSRREAETARRCMKLIWRCMREHERETIGEGRDQL